MKRRDLNLDLAQGATDQFLTLLSLPNKDLVGKLSLEYSLVNKSAPSEVKGGRLDYIVTKKKGAAPSLTASSEYASIDDGVPTDVGSVSVAVNNNNLQIQATNSVAAVVALLGSATLVFTESDLA
jgi:hypothetical protein